MISLRPAEARDLPFLTACAHAAYARYVPRLGREPMPMVQDFSAPVEAGHVALATMDGREAGYIVAFPKGSDLHIENVAVLPVFEGYGLGRALMKHAEATALENGLNGLDLYTNIVMTENLALYPKLGFVEYDRRTEDGFERVFFRKPLTPSQSSHPERQS